MNIDETTLAGALGRLTRYEFEQMSLKEALGVIVDAMPALFSVDGAGILLLDEQQDLRYVAATDKGAEVLEAAQETMGHGPCVTALLEDVPVVVDDVATDERWPDLQDVLANNGIRGVIGAPIHVTGTPIGSLNAYHRVPREWDESDKEAILAFDRVVERILTHAVLAQRNEATVDQLNHALTARIAIDRAVGILMGREDLNAADAFERLRRAARSSRRTVSDVATEVVAKRQLP